MQPRGGDTGCQSAGARAGSEQTGRRHGKAEWARSGQLRSSEFWKVCALVYLLSGFWDALVCGCSRAQLEGAAVGSPVQPAVLPRVRPYTQAKVRSARRMRQSRTFQQLGSRFGAGQLYALAHAHTHHGAMRGMAHALEALKAGARGGRGRSSAVPCRRPPSAPRICAHAAAR